MHENVRFPVDFLPEMVPGFFVVVSCYILYIIFHFLGPAVPPPTTGTQTSISSRILRFESKQGFFSSKMRVRSITAGESSGTDDSGSFRLEKNSTGNLRTIIFVVFGMA